MYVLITSAMILLWYLRLSSTQKLYRSLALYLLDLCQKLPDHSVTRLGTPRFLKNFSTSVNQCLSLIYTESCLSCSFRLVSIYGRKLVHYFFRMGEGGGNVTRIELENYSGQISPSINTTFSGIFYWTIWIDDIKNSRNDWEGGSNDDYKQKKMHFQNWILKLYLSS